MAKWQARRRFREGDAIWKASPLRLSDALRKIEAAWVLDPLPDTALLLASLYDRANRHDDALMVLRTTLSSHPDNATLRLQSAEAVLRHGSPEEIQAFVGSVLAVDPADAFCLFVKGLLEQYDAWSDQLVEEMAGAGDGRSPFLVVLPVWGQPYSDNSIRFALSSLLSPGNLPELAPTHAPFVAIFTDDATEAFFRAHPLFPKLEAHARVLFVGYGDRTAHRQAMESHYGSATRSHSDERLSTYYARTCKFLLMSCAHYVALHAARRVDGRVFCNVADLTLVDGALPKVAALLDSEADAVLFHSVQLPGTTLRPVLDARFRDRDGVVVIAPEEGERLLTEHVPERNFHGSDFPYDMLLRICWRVGRQGLLVHANHYHPIGFRPSRFDHPLRLTTDPVDSRFLDRTTLGEDRIHLAADATIFGLSVDDDPLFVDGSRPASPLAADDFALWLWGYWGRLRGFLFRNPLRLGRAADAEWRKVEAEASAVIEEILARTAALEAREALHKSRSDQLESAGCSASRSVPESRDG